MTVQYTPVTTRLIDWNAEVRKEWGEEYTQPETVYEFSNGREFHSTDKTDSGIYVP